MDPVTIGLISMGVGGAVKMFGGLFDNKADLLRQQAQLKLSNLEENMRRTEGAQTQVLSSTKARMAGTGFGEDSSSFTNYIKTMSTEFDAQNTAAHRQGLQQVDLMREGASAMDTQKWLTAGSDLFGTTANIAKLFQ